MRPLSPAQIYGLSEKTYEARKLNNLLFRELLGKNFPFVKVSTAQIITATSGLGLRASSGFGFMAQLNGGRSKEIVIVTRGTSTAADWATALAVRWPI